MKFTSNRVTAAAAMAALLALGACIPPPGVPIIPQPGTPTTDGISVDPMKLLPGAGSSGPGSVNYPVPSGNVLFVAPNGNDSAAGTLAAPLQTIQKAASRATNGTTIVLRGGTYNQTARVEKGTVTIQPYGNEVVWLDGSAVATGWVKDGSAARWSIPFTSNLAIPTQYASGGTWTAIDPNYPLAGDPHMVFVNGQSLTQVGSRAEVTTGKFFHDAAAKRMYIGTDPTAGEIRVTNLADALVVRTPDSTVRGIGVRRYGTHVDNHGALRFTAPRAVVEEVTVSQNAIAGLSLFSTDAVVRDVTADHNGRLGIHGHNSHRLRIESSAVFRNNNENFSTGGAAGGIKLTYASNAVVDSTASFDNNGKGIWFDLDANDSITTRSVVARNQIGIMVEMSTGGIVASNVVADSQGDGIRLLETTGGKVFNNTLLNNKKGIMYWDGTRAPVPTSGTMRNNAICAGPSSTDPLIAVDDANNKRSAEQMGAVSDNNAYYRRSTSTSTYVGAWANNPLAKLTSRTLAEHQTKTGQDTASVAQDAVDGCPFFGQYMAGAVNVAGAPLPADVAGALGMAAGQPVRIGVLDLG